MDDLLPLALSRPSEAMAKARAVLAGQPNPYDASIAHQAMGIALREFGDVTAGLREVQRALRLARRAGSPQRVADVQATLGIALVYAGRTTDGLATLDCALQNSSGLLAARVQLRRGMMLWTAGRHAAALEDMHRAISALRRAGDTLWLARALNARGLVYTSLGLSSRADADLVAAEHLWIKTNQEVEAIYTVGNRALVALSSGDIPSALSFLDAAAARFRPLKVPTTGLSIDRCLALLAAGLASDALTEAEAAIRDIDRIGGRSTKRAELLLTAAHCALAAEQAQRALGWAHAACRLFRSQRSEWWLARSSLVLAEARYAAGAPSVGLLRQASRAASRLEELSSGDATQAHLLAGRVALELGRTNDANRHLAKAARNRRRGTPLSRASGWLGEALRAGAAGDHRRQLAACRRGLQLLDEHRFTLGASELRAQATAHGTELAYLAQRHATNAGRSRQLLAWSERWRATALAVPSVRPSADPALRVGLVALRDVMKRLEEARRLGASNSFAKREVLRLERERQRLENTVRACALRSHGSAGPRHAQIGVSELLDELDDAQLLEIIEVDGLVHVLACGSGRVRRYTAGRIADVARASSFACFALRRLARGRSADDLGGALAILNAAGSRLQDALLGSAAERLRDRHVIIVPPGRLHAIPWALIPALIGRVFSVAPSAAAWMRARAVVPPSRRQITLARGPGLTSAGGEVAAVAPLYEDVTVLAGDRATSKNVLRALEGVWLAHIAAHGTFRADSPMFSSLRMHDGPLTVYDFEQLERAPYRLVLPSCDSGVQAPAGADELLGLVSSLLPLGTAGIVAAVVPLNDNAVVPVMVELHQHLRSGQTLAESMCSVRRGLSGDPVELGTAASLVALGAA